MHLTDLANLVSIRTEISRIQNDPWSNLPKEHVQGLAKKLRLIDSVILDSILRIGMEQGHLEIHEKTAQTT